MVAADVVQDMHYLNALVRFVILFSETVRGFDSNKKLFEMWVSEEQKQQMLAYLNEVLAIERKETVDLVSKPVNDMISLLKNNSQFNKKGFQAELFTAFYYFFDILLEKIPKVIDKIRETEPTITSKPVFANKEVAAYRLYGDEGYLLIPINSTDRKSYFIPGRSIVVFFRSGNGVKMSIYDKLTTENKKINQLYTHSLGMISAPYFLIDTHHHDTEIHNDSQQLRERFLHGNSLLLQVGPLEFGCAPSHSPPREAVVCKKGSTIDIPGRRVTQRPVSKLRDKGYPEIVAEKDNLFETKQKTVSLKDRKITLQSIVPRWYWNYWYDVEELFLRQQFRENNYSSLSDNYQRSSNYPRNQHIFEREFVRHIERVITFFLRKYTMVVPERVKEIIIIFGRRDFKTNRQILGAASFPLDSETGYVEISLETLFSLFNKSKKYSIVPTLKHELAHIFFEYDLHVDNEVFWFEKFRDEGTAMFFERCSKKPMPWVFLGDFLPPDELFAQIRSLSQNMDMRYRFLYILSYEYMVALCVVYCLSDYKLRSSIKIFEMAFKGLGFLRKIVPVREVPISDFAVLFYEAKAFSIEILDDKVVPGFLKTIKYMSVEKFKARIEQLAMFYQKD